MSVIFGCDILMCAKGYFAVKAKVFHLRSVSKCVVFEGRSVQVNLRSE